MDERARDNSGPCYTVKMSDPSDRPGLMDLDTRPDLWDLMRRIHEDRPVDFMIKIRDRDEDFKVDWTSMHGDEREFTVQGGAGWLKDGCIVHKMEIASEGAQTTLYGKRFWMVGGGSGVFLPCTKEFHTHISALISIREARMIEAKTPHARGDGLGRRI